MRLKKLTRKILNPFAYVFCWLFIRVIQLLPHGMLLFIAAVLGRLGWLIPSYRKLILANLEIAFPDWDPQRRKDIGCKSLQNISLTFMEFLWFQKRLDKISAQVTNPEFLKEGYDQAKAQTDSVIFICPHIGNWEVANILANQLGIPIKAVARHLKVPWAEKLFMESRTATGAGIIHEKGAAKEILRCLKNGENLAMLIDQNTKPDEGGIFVPFYGLPVCISRAPAAMAIRTNSNILVAGIIRESKSKLKTFCRPLPKNTSDYDNPQELSADINKVTESIINDYPDQYLWLYPRFRYIPPEWEGDRSRYPSYAKLYEPKQKKQTKPK